MYQAFISVDKNSTEAAADIIIEFVDYSAFEF